jgi:RHS repeat-associated protein
LTGSTGTVTGKCTYSAYGTPACEGTTTTPLGYDGQYTSTDTGLIYMRARVYDPATAQFLTRDPLAAISGEPYSYAGDKPVNESDPTGLLFGIKLPSWEEGAEALAGWGDTITFGVTKKIREGIGDENVDTCSGAYQAGGDAGLATGLLIPGEDDAELAEGTTTLYRAVGDEEAADISATGTYRVPPGGVEGKYFTSSQEQAQGFIDSGWATTLTSAEFPNSIVAASDPVSLGGEGSGYLVPATFFPFGPVSIGGG